MILWFYNVKNIVLKFSSIRQSHLDDHPVDVIFRKNLAFVEEDGNPAVHEVGFDGIFAAGETGDDALDIGRCGDVAGQDVELVIMNE